MTREDLTVLKRSIWPLDAVRPVRIYAVLDAARDPFIFDLIARSYRERSCLFAGNLDPELERAAPHLLELNPADSVTDEILVRGLQNAWGVLVQTESSFRSLRHHLRTLLRVRTEDGRFSLFRFYDPRVLNIYLPTCTPEELALFYGQDTLTWFSFSTTGEALQSAALHDGELRTELLMRFGNEALPSRSH